MSHDRNGDYGPEIPDPEVEPRAVRRHYAAEYKQRILDEIDHASLPGEIGAILRREGLYSQIISKWRQQRAQGGLEGLEPQKRGPKAKPEAAELARLKRENERLRKKLERAELIIEVQKKVSQMFGGDESDPSEPSSSRKSRD
jgi:transposase